MTFMTTAWDWKTDWFRKAKTDLDDYERLLDDLYYNKESDEYIVVISYDLMDATLSGDGFGDGEEPDIEEVESGYAEFYRAEYCDFISNDYTEYEFVRKHLCYNSKEYKTLDQYESCNVGRLYLRRG